MDSVDESEARELLTTKHYCDDACSDDWEILDRPKGAFSFEQGLVDEAGKGSGLVVAFHFYRSPDTKLITIKMSVFVAKRRQPKVRVYQLQITTKSYQPENWHDEAHEHFGKGRDKVESWTTWSSFSDALNYFSSQTNIEFRPRLEDPEQLRLTP
jgi:hypothetical protein